MCCPAGWGCVVGAFGFRHRFVTRCWSCAVVFSQLWHFSAVLVTHAVTGVTEYVPLVTVVVTQSQLSLRSRRYSHQATSFVQLGDGPARQVTCRTGTLAAHTEEHDHQHHRLHAENTARNRSRMPAP